MGKLIKKSSWGLFKKDVNNVRGKSNQGKSFAFVEIIANFLYLQSQRFLWKSFIKIAQSWRKQNDIKNSIALRN